jgi:hypothetical protein
MLLPWDEGGKGNGISSTFKLLKEMGGVLSFSKFASKAKFTVSLVKCCEAAHSEAVQGRQPG